MITELRQKVLGAFSRQFGGVPTWVVRAPGRVNLIGEHTDYNEGFVMPLAIDRQILIALRKRDDGRIVVHSLDFENTLALAPSQLRQPGNDGWGEYVKGVVRALQQADYEVCGWEGVVAGDIPKGAGLSSSAALELAVAKACAVASDMPWDPVHMALIGQKAENEWVGMQCGIMDQMISACGEEGHALLIDCRTFETTPVPLPQNTVIAVMDTGTRRGLVDSAYNERRRQCQEAAGVFGKAVLRDLTMADLNARKAQLTDLQYRRAKHVIGENQRVLDAMAAMQRQDAGALGQLMVASHESLRDDFEVSSPELNAIVSCAMAQSGCYGARMTGAGFGGCAVALIDINASHDFLRAVALQYQKQTHIEPAMYLCNATAGADIL